MQLSMSGWIQFAGKDATSLQLLPVVGLPSSDSVSADLLVIAFAPLSGLSAESHLPLVDTSQIMICMTADAVGDEIVHM